MAAKNSIIYRLEGTPQNERHLDLQVFKKKIDQLYDFLQASAKDSGAEPLSFRIVNLSHDSPVTLECELSCAQIGAADRVLQNIDSYCDLVGKGKADALPAPVCAALEKLAQAEAEDFCHAEIQLKLSGNQKYIRKLDANFSKDLLDSKKIETYAISTLSGKLEAANIHEGTNTFRIYRGWRQAPSVTCKFPPDLLEIVKKSLGRFVSVSGKCGYHPDASLPHKMDVRTMELLPPPETLPTLSDLRGIAPNLTQGKSTEEFLREVRAGWNRNQ